MNKEDIISIGLELKDEKNIEILARKYEEWRNIVLEKCEPDCRAEYKIALHVPDSVFESKEQKIKHYQSAIDKTLALLKNDDNKSAKVVENVIENFNLFMQNMFAVEPDKKATLKKEYLEHIKINNEYDVQHIMYAMIKAIYPNARREVTQDIGYGFDRYDIVMDEIDTVIEIKCTRKDHTDKKLLRELGEDAFFYKCSNLIIYVYDKSTVIKDVDNFTRALEKNKDEAGKNIRVIVDQAKELI